MLNHVYRVIFNRSTGCYVAVSEIAKSSGKTTTARIGSIPNTVTSIAGQTLRRHAINSAIIVALGLVIMPSSYAVGCVTGVTHIEGGLVVVQKTGTDIFNSVACGLGNNASADRSSAMGAGNEAFGVESSAIGSANTASALESSAIGSFNTASGVGSSSIGSDNNASGGNSLAVGSVNKATGLYSSAMGISNAASGEASLAVGAENVASGLDSSAMGRSNTALGDDSSAVGSFNDASGVSSSALGNGNTASGTMSSAMGIINTASGEASSAIGAENVASGLDSSAMGRSNTASGDDSSAVGSFNEALGVSSLAAGSRNIASGDYSSAFGSDALADKPDSVALGSNSVTTVGAGVAGYDPRTRSDSRNTSPIWRSTLSAVSVGDTSSIIPATWKTRQITGVAAGARDTDAVNVSQLQQGLNHNAFQLQVDLSSTVRYGGTDKNFVFLGNVDTPVTITNVAPASNALNGVNYTQLKGIASVIGGGSEFDSVGSFKAPSYTINGNEFNDVGSAFAEVDGNLTALQTQVDTIISPALGTKGDKGVRGLAGVNGKDGIQGDNVSVTKEGTIAVGVNSKSTGENSITVGTDSTVTGNQSLSVGVGNIVSGDKSGAIGDPSIIGGDSSYSLGNDNIIGDTSNNVSVIGSNIKVGATSASTVDGNPVFTGVTDASNSVAIGESVNVQATDAVAIGANSSVTHSNAVALGANSQSTADNTVSVGNANTQRRITNVAAGINPNDAVNVSQLNQNRAEAMGYTDRRINDLEGETYSAVAGALAFGALRYPNVPGKVSVGLGGGTWEGETGYALGVGYTTSNGLFSISSAFGGSGSQQGGNVGVSYTFD